MARFHKDGTLPAPGEVLVFGSNLAGRHGLGAAKLAREQYGAIWGQGAGLQGQSYGIPTRDGRPGTPSLRSPAATLTLDEIQRQVASFVAYANAHPAKQFFITRVGCGLAGHRDADIAPFFSEAGANCSFPQEWGPFLGAASQELLPLF